MKRSTSTKAVAIILILTLHFGFGPLLAATDPALAIEQVTKFHRRADAKRGRQFFQPMIDRIADQNERAPVGWAEERLLLDPLGAE